LTILSSLLHLLFPHLCDGCGSDLLGKDSSLCLKCISTLPITGFEKLEGNPIEKKFYGRIPLDNATAQFYFGKSSRMQELMHLLKYRNHRELGIQLGRLMGDSLQRSGRFNVDAIIPLPLFHDREKKRGYNQSFLLCEGIRESLQKPILNNVITRPLHTETQTKKGRIERWKNIEGKFLLKDPTSIKGMKLLLVDDVITTGATLEACGSELLKAGISGLNIAALCYAYS
jgi:ComF family protein